MTETLTRVCECGKQVKGSAQFCSRACLHLSLRRFDWDEATRLYLEEKLSTGEVAKRCGVSTAVVVKALKRNGVTIRPRYSHIYSEDGTQRRCSKCRTFKLLDDFAAGREKRRAAWCKACMRQVTREWHRKDPARARSRHRLQTHGMPEEVFQDMKAQQGGVCAICKNPEKILRRGAALPPELTVDHDHETGEIRGLLCTACNAGLGQFGDDVENLKAAIAYLEKKEGE